MSKNILLALTLPLLFFALSPVSFASTVSPASTFGFVPAVGNAIDGASSMITPTTCSAGLKQSQPGGVCPAGFSEVSAGYPGLFNCVSSSVAVCEAAGYSMAPYVDQQWQTPPGNWLFGLGAFLGYPIASSPFFSYLTIPIDTVRKTATNLSYAGGYYTFCGSGCGSGAPLYGAIPSWYQFKEDNTYVVPSAPVGSATLTMTSSNVYPVASASPIALCDTARTSATVSAGTKTWCIVSLRYDRVSGGGADRLTSATARIYTTQPTQYRTPYSPISTPATLSTPSPAAPYLFKQIVSRPSTSSGGQFSGGTFRKVLGSTWTPSFEAMYVVGPTVSFPSGYGCVSTYIESTVSSADTCLLYETTANPPTVSLMSNPTSVSAGGTSALSWTSTNATSCTSTTFSSGGTTSGTVVATVPATTEYAITCTGTAGSATASTTVTVNTVQCSDGVDNDSDGTIDTADAGCVDGNDNDESGEVRVTLTATPTSVVSGSSATLTWDSTGTSCTSTNFTTGGLADNAVGVSTGPLTSNTNYSISCTGPGGTGTDTASVSVTNPTVSLTAAKDRVVDGGSTTLSWDGDQVTACTLTGTNGLSYTAGMDATAVPSGAITTQTTFTVSCDSGAASDKAIVNVNVDIDEF